MSIYDQLCNQYDPNSINISHFSKNLCSLRIAAALNTISVACVYNQPPRHDKTYDRPLPDVTVNVHGHQKPELHNRSPLNIVDKIANSQTIDND